MPRAPRGSFLVAASTQPCGRTPLLFQRCRPAVCLHSPLLLGRPCQGRSGPTHSVGRGSRVPFASLSPKGFFKPFNFRSGPTDCLVEALRVPFAGLQTAQPSAAALDSTVLSKRLNPPQPRYTLSCWRLKTSNPLNAPQPPSTLSCSRFKATVCEPSQPLTHCLVGAAKVPAFKPLNAPQRPLHSVLLKLLLKTPGCQPSKASTLRSGLTLYCWGVTPFAGLQRRTVRSGTTHSVVGVHECRLPAFRPFFKPLNPPQWLYTLSCWSFKTTIC